MGEGWEDLLPEPQPVVIQGQAGFQNIWALRPFCIRVKPSGFHCNYAALSKMSTVDSMTGCKCHAYGDSYPTLSEPYT